MEKIKVRGRVSKMVFARDWRASVFYYHKGIMSEYEARFHTTKKSAIAECEQAMKKLGWELEGKWERVWWILNRITHYMTMNARILNG